MAIFCIREHLYSRNILFAFWKQNNSLYVRSKTPCHNRTARSVCVRPHLGNHSANKWFEQRTNKCVSHVPDPLNKSRVGQIPLLFVWGCLRQRGLCSPPANYMLHVGYAEAVCGSPGKVCGVFWIHVSAELMQGFRYCLVYFPVSWALSGPLGNHGSGVTVLKAGSFPPQAMFLFTSVWHAGVHTFIQIQRG